ncbi:hypothetical protein C3V36_01430 [Lachnospiraceae bacterium oral taxon 500]|nr:hypothetical protein C3V36_01430 [Lachnospiraceae bacterium oral taxon 500]
MRSLEYTIKSMFREKAFVFWTILYPIILCSFFYLAFGSLLTEKPIRFAVGIGPDNELKGILKNIEALQLKEYPAEAAEDALKSGEIAAYVTGDMEVLVAKSGVSQTAVQNIVTNLKQFFYLFEHGADPAGIDFDKTYIKMEQQRVSPYALMFYTLLGMVCFYGFFGGVQILDIFQADVSELGKRMTVSPIKKGPYIFSGLAVVVSLNLLANLLLIAYINWGLKIHLFTEYPASLGLIAAGNLVGITMGVWLGSNSRLSPQLKTGLGIGIPLFLSALSGMMSISIKTMIMRCLPWLDQINPVSIITSGLYRINLLGNYNYYGRGIFILLALSTMFALLSVRALRRRSYDSF